MSSVAGGAVEVTFAVGITETAGRGATDALPGAGLLGREDGEFPAERVAAFAFAIGSRSSPGARESPMASKLSIRAPAGKVRGTGRAGSARKFVTALQRALQGAGVSREHLTPGARYFFVVGTGGFATAGLAAAGAAAGADCADSHFSASARAGWFFGASSRKRRNNVDASRGRFM